MEEQSLSPYITLKGDIREEPSMHWRYFDLFVLLCPGFLCHQGTSPERDNPLEPANQNRSAEEGAP